LIYRAQMAVLRGETAPDAGSTRSAEVDSVGLEVMDALQGHRWYWDELDRYELTNAQGDVIEGGIRGICRTLSWKWR
jgi:hypothetical protein